MLLNYIKIAFRNIQRNKLHSFINILGLAMGIACAVLLLLTVREMRSYYKHHSKHDRIYMVQSDFTFIGKELFNYGTSRVVGPALKGEYPVIEDYVRIIPSSRIFFYDNNNEIIGEDGICFADPSIFSILDHNFIYGSPEGSLESPKTIVLSKTLAQKYFGNENPVGKILPRNNGIDYKVTGVFEDLSKKTFRHYTALMPMRDYAMSYGIDKFNTMEPETFFDCNGSHFTFILLNKNADIQSIRENSDRFHKKYIEDIEKKTGKDLNLVFEPLVDVYLNYRPTINGPQIYVMTISLFVLLAIFILVVACINYTNIATAQSEARAKEVGVRKVMGANRLLLIRQFLCESIVITICALLIAFVLIELGLPGLNNITDRDISFSVLMEPYLAVRLVILILCVGILSGVYPAIFLSSFLPASVLRGSLWTGKRKGRLRKLLVILQFTLSLILINFTFVFEKYVDFWLHADLGFNVKDVLLIENSAPEVRKAIPLLREELIKNSEISAVSGSFAKVGSSVWSTSLNVENSEKEMVDFHTAHLGVDFEFINMLDIKLVNGRNFNREITSDVNSAFIVTETFVKDMGWKDSPISKRIKLGDKEGKIIGVIKDFHYMPLIAMLRPLVIYVQEGYLTEGAPVTYIKLNSQNRQKTVDFIKEKWKKLIPAYPFEYKYLEDSISEQYDFPKRLHKVFNLFSILCIFISCLGLFGLSSYVTERRTKEIGIRKVYGANVIETVMYVSSGFLKLIILSGIIGSMFIDLMMRPMEQIWAYSPEINLYNINFIALAIVFGIALVTVSYHVVKAALTDPVKTLRYE